MPDFAQLTAPQPVRPFTVGGGIDPAVIRWIGYGIGAAFLLYALNGRRRGW